MSNILHKLFVYLLYTVDLVVQLTPCGNWPLHLESCGGSSGIAGERTPWNEIRKGENREMQQCLFGPSPRCAGELPEKAEPLK